LLMAAWIVVAIMFVAFVPEDAHLLRSSAP
jgi:hypothetical protein